MVTIYQFHSRILRDVFPTGLSDTDAFLVFCLLHNYRINVQEGSISDRASVRAIEPITQRDSAAAIASIWTGTDDVRASPSYWYFRWNGEWGSYGHFENLSEEESSRLKVLERQLCDHPLIARFEEDE